MKELDDYHQRVEQMENSQEDIDKLKKKIDELEEELESCEVGSILCSAPQHSAPQHPHHSTASCKPSCMCTTQHSIVSSTTGILPYVQHQSTASCKPSLCVHPVCRQRTGS